ncbi:fungal-specific transcription factor domain-containing protein [Xylogone sp. PMI_703]|nr:fungal-specific transcription factor domain-containing protein [Xylogone sp. PMI_703]
MAHPTYRDTLQRHRQIHDDRRPPPRSRKKACDPCFRSKIKCQAERPVCSSCQKRRLRCVYAHVSESTESSRPPAETSASFDYGEMAEIEPIVDEPMSEGATVDVGLPSPSSGRVMSDSTPHDTTSRFDPLENFLPAYSPVLVDSNLLDSFFGQPGLQHNLNLSWIFNDPPVDGFPSLANSPGLSFLPSARQPLASEIEQMLSSNNQEDMCVVTQTNYQNSNMQENDELENSWLAEWNTIPVQQLVLPDLGSSDEQVPTMRYYFITPIRSSVRDRLLDTIRRPLQRGPWEEVSLVHFPSNEKLDHCIDLFFAHFNKFLPIIHRPTFDPGKDTLVTLMIICIGSCYTLFKGAREFSNTLSEICRRLLLIMAERDSRFLQKDYYNIAQLLQGTQGYCSGKKHLFECSDSWRSSLVNTAKSMDLFHYQAPPTSNSSGTIEERWHTWIRQERLRRLAWAIYEYDSSVAYLHNTRSYITVGDMTLDLPSSSAHWEAETAEAWAALHPWSHLPVGVPFRSTIRTLYDGTTDPLAKIQDESHRKLIMLTLFRMVWTLKEISRSPINDLIDNYYWMRSSKALLRGLDMFLESPYLVKASAKYTTERLENVVRKAQIIHISHLFGSGDLMDLVYSLVRPSSDTKVPESRLLQWANNDSKRVRKVAFHAAQTLAIARCFPFNMPLEPFNVFHAGVTLWCMAALLPQHEVGDPTTLNMPSIQLDHLSKHVDDPFDETINKWIGNGGAGVVGIFSIPDISTSEGKIRVLELTVEILNKMTVWGVAQNFVKVVLELIQRTRSDDVDQGAAT